MGKPFILTVEPTNVCNLRCPLCVTGNGRMTRTAGKLEFETFKRLIDELGDYLFYILLYQQGEPFINKSFLDFVAYAKTRRIFVTTSTNAHYFDIDTARRTVASGLDSIIVSIDGASQTSYETYRVGGELAKVTAGVRNLVAERNRQRSRTPKVFIQFIMMRHNEREIASMRELTRDLGADKLLLKTVQVETEAEAVQWLPADESRRRYRTGNGSLQPKRKAIGPCVRPWTSSLINWDGSVVPCCFDKNGEYEFGSTKNGKEFSQIWMSEKYDLFRDKMLTERSSLSICRNCSQGIRLYL
jgi:radical SAM protein with 4Fe4S-binding SPASM domain